MTILIVDDDETVLAVVNDLIQTILSSGSVTMPWLSQMVSMRWRSFVETTT